MTRPFDHRDGPVGYVTLAMCQRLVRLAMKVARDATDRHVVEEARRIADELRAAARDRVRAANRECQRRRRADLHAAVARAGKEAA